MPLRDLPPLPLPAPMILAQIDEPPGLPMPGSVAALPASKVADDRSDVGFLYAQLVAAEGVAATAVQRAGDTMTGMLTVNPASGNKLQLQKAGTNRFLVDVNGALDINADADIGVLAQFRHQGITDVFISSSGNMHCRGNFGVGPNADTPPNRLTVHEAEIKFWTSNENNPKSGGRGWHIDKVPAALAIDEVSSIVSFDVGGTPRWEIGIDFETQRIGDGNSDFVPAFDHSAGINDAGANANTGADIMRISPASHCVTHGQGPKFNFDAVAGSPRAFPDFMTVTAGKNLGGLRVSANHDVTKVTQTLAQRSATHNRTSTALANANDAAPLWEYGVDLLAAGRAVWGFSFQDHKTTSAKDTRLFIEGTNNLIGKVGFNTVLPMSQHHLIFSNAAGDFDTVQSHWLASFEDTGVDAAHHNRAINIQSILDAGTVKNFLLLSGGLGTTSTTATPTLTSTGAGAFGLERTDTELSLVGAGAGANQTIVRGLRMNTSGQLGFYGTAPAARQAVGAASSDLATVVTLANNLRAALIANGMVTA